MTNRAKLGVAADKEQILCKIRSSVSALRTHSHILNLSAVTLRISRFLQGLAKAMARILAPLRRIVSRELEVFSYDRVLEIPQSFIIHDHLECGHVQDCLTWDALDLLNAYTENPEVASRRHRCRPCASLLASKKPVQSIGLTTKVEVA